MTIQITDIMPISNGIWTKDDELKFFEDSLKLVSIEKLFYYTNACRYLAYWPKIIMEEKVLYRVEMDV